MTDVSVVILNYNTRDQLEKFLPSVIEYSEGCEIIIVDNGSSDDSVAYLNENHPTLRLILLNENLGYTGGYNEALSQLQSKYFVLLNSDVEVTEGWVSPLVKLLDSDTEISAVQPKILSYHNKKQFEYAGAGGGLIDWLGYPFCRGRIFDALEIDDGQYDDITEVFWASGACLFIRASDFSEIGGFDKDFFAHMEEIDLCWRLKNRGKKIYYNGKSTVYHLGGGTLSKSNPRKTFLNFRNGLEMISKNLPLKNLIITLPIRLGLDWVAMLKFTFFDSPKDGFAVLKAIVAFISRVGKISRKRTKIKFRTAGIYTHSIVWAHFIKKYNKYTDLN